METLRTAQRPMIILGRGAIQRPDGAGVLAAAWAVARAANALREDWHGFNLMHHFGGQVGALELGFVPAPGGLDAGAMIGGGVDALWLLGADSFDAAAIPPETFVVYQGHHGDRGAARADVILPGAAYTEKDATYVNTEGRAQRGWLAVHAPGEAREDWRIIRAAGEALGVRLPFDDAVQLRDSMIAYAPQLDGRFTRAGCGDVTGPAGDPTAMEDAPFALPIAQYHLADVIARASIVMTECAQIYADPPQLQAAE